MPPLLMRGVALGVALALSSVPAMAAPALGGGGVSPSTWSAAPGLTVQWTQSGIEESGATAVLVQMNEADDGTGSGAWTTVWSENGPASGSRTAVLSTERRDGKRALRVVVRAGTQTLASMALGPALIDHAPPVLTRPGALHGPTQTVLSWAEEDLHAGLDPVAGHHLEANTGPNGGAEGAWVPLPFAPSGEGAQQATVPAAALSPGAHLVRARAIDRAGNEASLVLGTAYNDSTPPTVTGVRVVESPTARSQTVEIAYGVSDSLPGSGFAAGVPSALTTESGSTTLWEGAQGLAGGEQRIRAYLPGPRTYRLVVRVADRAGNTGVSAPVTVTSPAPARADVARPSLRLRLALVGGPVRREGARRVAVARIVHGQRVTIRGTLTSGAGRPVRREEVEVRDASGRMVGRALTDGAGRFRLTVAPHTGGDLRVGIPLGGGRLALPVASTTVRVRVRPRVSLAVSSRTAVAGASPVVFTGRVVPGPGTLRGTPRKRVVLEWQDPLRREWRPVLNGYANADGRYRFSWRFGVPGFGVPMRVSVPPELGWPFEPALSRAVTVVVR